MSRPTLIITVEGNIGAGKSTILEMIRQRLTHCHCVQIIPEPAEEWMQRQYLQKMYNKSIDACTFQIAVLTSLTTRLMTMLQSNPKPLVIITERSPFSNLNIFAKWKLDRDQLDIYEYVWTDVISMLSATNVTVRHVVLHGDADTLIERIRSRNRECEQCLDVENIKALETRHQLWMKEMDPDVVMKVSHEQTAINVATDVCEAIATFIRCNVMQFSKDDQDELNAVCISVEALPVPSQHQQI